MDSTNEGILPPLSASYVLDSSVVNVIMYAFLGWAVLFIMWWEKRDCYCPNSPYDPDELCGELNGMFIAGTLATDKDSSTDIINKTIEAAKGESKQIKWRRAFFLSIFITLSSSLLITRTLPDWKEFLAYTVISFAILYFAFNFYSYHVNNKVAMVIEKNMEMLRKRKKD